MSVDPSAVTAAEPTSGAAPASTGRTVGKYRLDRVLGSGGMGVVWAAFDPDLERAVAVKLLHAENSEQTLRSRLLREARAMARLRHPNVVTVFDVGTDQNRDYIAMELVDGGTLDAWLETKPTRDARLKALLAAGRGLAAAHTAGLVHRDFKPHNVLRASDGHVYVTDFGLARGQIEDGPELVQISLPVEELTSGSQPRRGRDSVLDSPLTQTGVLIGTPAYMAPEQFAGRVPDPKCDQFAFCITAWEALTGARPFRGATLAELEAAARGGVGELSVDLPPPLREVLARGLSPSPDARWSDMPALLAALAEAIAAPRPVRRRSRRWITAGVAALGLAGGIAVFAATRSRPAAAADECQSAEQAWGNAWGPDRAALLRGSHGPVSIGMFAVLEEVRQQWMRSYASVCERPQTARTRQILTCLHGVRDNIAQTVARLEAPGSKLEITDIALLAAGVEVCDPESRDDGHHEPSMPSMPPAPPEPPE
jgi:serine/threonine protein kinase